MTLEMKCQMHWQRLGIKDLKTLKEHIKAIFDKYQHQEEVLIDLYKMILPDWDLIKRVEGFPGKFCGLRQAPNCAYVCCRKYSSNGLL